MLGVQAGVSLRIPIRTPEKVILLGGSSTGFDHWGVLWKQLSFWVARCAAEMV